MPMTTPQTTSQPNAPAPKEVTGTTDSNTFWNFGTGSQYPVLNGIDVDKDGDTDADDISAQRPSP